MSEVSAEQQQNDPLDEAKVIEYLQQNPEVLMAYPAIFSSLSIPHETGVATSLLERQLKLLRDENQSLKSKIDELVVIARENEELNQRFHRLALELMHADQLHDVLAMVQDQVQTFFYTDFVCFRFLVMGIFLFSPNFETEKWTYAHAEQGTDFEGFKRKEVTIH